MFMDVEKHASFSSGVRFLYFSPVALVSCAVSATVREPCVCSWKKMAHGPAGSFFGELSNAASFSSFSLAILSFVTVALLGAFLTIFLTAFFGLGLGPGLALGPGLDLGVDFAFGPGVAFSVFALGFAPTLALPSAVLGPGFLAVAALVVFFAGVRPVYAFGRLAGFFTASVAYVRVLMP